MFKLLKYFVVSLIAIGVIISLDAFQFFYDIEQASVDLREIAFSPETVASKRIVMVWLDEDTMAKLPYRSPVPRDFLTKLNDRLRGAGPVAIGYDIYFKDPSFPSADQVLAKSLAISNSYAVAPMRDGGEHEGLVDPPMPLFAKALKGVGLADLPIAAFDTKVRSARLSYRTDLGNTPTFSALLYRAATGADAIDAVGADWHWPSLGPIKFTPFLDNHKRILIRFAGPPSKLGSGSNAFQIFPAHLVADGLVPPKWFKDKIILVGAAYSDLMDAYPTPYYGRSTGFARMNGVEIHANVLNQLITGQLYYGLNSNQRWVLIVMVVLACAACALFLSPMKSSLITILISAFVVSLAVYTSQRYGIFLPIVAPIAAAAFAFGIGIIFRALSEGRQKKMIKQVFARYVPQAVVDQLSRDPGLAKLGGEERTVTSLFTDLASFTSLSEKLPPTKVVDFLNGYLERMNKIILGHGGTIDKYEGDAIIAFFNAPLDVEDHQTKALKSALEIQNATAAVTSDWKDILGDNLITRVGIHTGQAVVGNLGSEGRFDYTAIGDTINLASRLEGANKFYGTTVLASSETIEFASNEIITRPLDQVKVKGRDRPVILYEVMGMRKDLDKKFMEELILPYHEAYGLFSERKIEDALQIFSDISNRHPNDGPSINMLERCRRARENPEWDLITELSSK